LNYFCFSEQVLEDLIVALKLVQPDNPNPSPSSSGENNNRNISEEVSPESANAGNGNFDDDVTPGT
jgi:hypothetical protein